MNSLINRRLLSVLDPYFYPSALTEGGPCGSIIGLGVFPFNLETDAKENAFDDIHGRKEDGGRRWVREEILIRPALLFFEPLLQESELRFSTARFSAKPANGIQKSVEVSLSQLLDGGIAVLVEAIRFAARHPHLIQEGGEEGLHVFGDLRERSFSVLWNVGMAVRSKVFNFPGGSRKVLTGGSVRGVLTDVGPVKKVFGLLNVTDNVGQEVDVLHCFGWFVEGSASSCRRVQI